MKVAIVAITKKGKAQSLKLKKALPKSRVYIYKEAGRYTLKELSQRLFIQYRGIIFCMALGIVVRVIAPFLKNKHTDPAVVAVDDCGRFSISVLSGHEGGANKLAILAANILGAQAVVTTASEAAKDIAIGIGCRRRANKNEVIKAIKYALKTTGCSINKIRCISTIDIKQNETGLKSACLGLGIPLQIISTNSIKRFKGIYQRSPFVKEKIGVEGVSEPCALLAVKKPKLILPKQKIGRVTVAVAQEA